MFSPIKFVSTLIKEIADESPRAYIPFHLAVKSMSTPRECSKQKLLPLCKGSKRKRNDKTKFYFFPNGAYIVQKQLLLGTTNKYLAVFLHLGTFLCIFAKKITRLTLYYQL